MMKEVKDVFLFCLRPLRSFWSSMIDHQLLVRSLCGDGEVKESGRQAALSHIGSVADRHHRPASIVFKTMKTMSREYRFNFRLLSSHHSLRAALTCSCCGDSMTRDWPVALRVLAA